MSSSREDRAYPTMVRFGTKFRYASDILREEREYWVDLPESYDPAALAKTAHPVLYLLDAERLFAQAAATVKCMSQLGTVPEMIVVGIPSTDARTRTSAPSCKSFEDENHQSVPFPAFYYGLSFTFSDYQVPMTNALKEPGYIVLHYRQFSERRGATFEPPETAFSTVGAELLFEQKKVDEAIALLEENVRLHPSSSQALQYLGEAFLMKDDKGAAIRGFERMLQLKPGDAEVPEQLKRLRAK